MSRLRKAKYYSQMVRDGAEGAFKLMMDLYKQSQPLLRRDQLELLAWEMQCNNLKEELLLNVFKIMHEADILTALNTRKVRLYLENDEYDEDEQWD